MYFTLEELMRSLEQSLATGNIGVPVSARVRIVTPDADPQQVFAAIMKLLSRVWSLDRFSLRAIQHATGIQTDVQIHLSAGPTISVTLVRSPAGQSSCKFLLTGNHGMIRLEGEHEFQFQTPKLDMEGEKWVQLLQESLGHQEVVRADRSNA